MDNKEFALKLAMCESEDSVIALLKEQNVWDDNKYWRSFGDNDNNWSTIGNQQSDADAALVEKIVNSVDALLMKECLCRGIDPESDEAPKTIAEGPFRGTDTEPFRDQVDDRDHRSRDGKGKGLPGLW